MIRADVHGAQLPLFRDHDPETYGLALEFGHNVPVGALLDCLSDPFPALVGVDAAGPSTSTTPPWGASLGRRRDPKR